MQVKDMGCFPLQGDFYQDDSISTTKYSHFWKSSCKTIPTVLSTRYLLAWSKICPKPFGRAEGLLSSAIAFAGVQSK